MEPPQLRVLQGTAGVLGNSAAMVADAVHSLSDLVSDYVTIWAVRLSRTPPDREHPCRLFGLLYVYG